MTLTSDGKFSCEWSNINNCLFRCGLKFDCMQTYCEIGNITCDFAANSEAFRPTLQYNTASVTNYDGIVEAEAANGEWVVLENTAFTITEGSWGCSFTLRLKAGPTASISTKRSGRLGHDVGLCVRC